ncbi:MAG: ABC transporter ATP-binding protein [Bacteroidota bacterium]|nr:ABC transporter ATP-binding protein [Bacteroidota bacterium]
MKKLWKVLRFAVPYKGHALLNILFNVVGVFFSLASLSLFIPVLQILFKQTSKMLVAPPPITLNPLPSTKLLTDNFNYFISRQIDLYGEQTALLYICVAIVALFFLKNFFRYMAMFFLAPVRNGVVKDIRNDLYRKMLYLPLGYYSDQRKGDLMARLTTDVQEVEWSIMSTLEMLFREPITIIVYLVTMVVVSPRLTLFVMVLLPISGLIIGQIGKSLKRTSVKGQRKMGELLSIIEETISGLRIIKAFNAIGYSRKKFEEHNTAYYRLMNRLYRKRDLASPLSEFLGAIVITVVLWYGGKLVFSASSSLQASVFLFYLAIFSQLLNPAKAIVQSIYNIQKGAASVDRIEYVLSAEETITQKENAIQHRQFEHQIEYRNVSFQYEKDEVLKNINLIIPKGKTVALVGTSGGGKSTLVDLLPRFYDVVNGAILIDGIPITDLVIRDLRDLMGIVSQETILFNGSLYENIAFGLDNIKLEDVVAAAKVANAHEFIEKMDQGYDTNIGDRGVKLSGGQRQRISIARAVLKNPPILILDEATSALDTESERLVQDALTNLMKNRTSIVIAHRLSTIQHADEIVVMQQGEIVERGTHADLLANNGVYKKLNEMQSLV